MPTSMATATAGPAEVSTVQIATWTMSRAPASFIAPSSARRRRLVRGPDDDAVADGDFLAVLENGNQSVGLDLDLADHACRLAIGRGHLAADQRAGLRQCRRLQDL